MTVSDESQEYLDFAPEIEDREDLQNIEENRDRILALPMMTKEKYNEILANAKMQFVAHPY